MKNLYVKHQRLLITVFALTVLLVGASVVAVSRKIHSQGQATREVKHAVVVPHILSTQDIEATAIIEGDPNSEFDATLLVTVRNKSSVPVASLSLRVGENSMTLIPVPESDEYKTVLEPQQVKTIRFSLANVKPNQPLRVAALFADGVEQGDSNGLQIIREHKEDWRKRVKQ